MSRVAEIEVDPSDVYFTHSRIRPFFTGVGCAIEHTIAEIAAGKLRVEDIPLVTVLHNGSSYFSLNNRRLYMLKHLKERGLLKGGVCKVRLKAMLAREASRYTVQNCVLHATLMGRGSSEEMVAEDVEELALGTEAAEVKASEVDAAMAVRQKARSGSSGAAPKRTAISNAADLGAGAQQKLRALLKLADKGKTEQCSRQLERLLEERTVTEEEMRFMAQELGI